MTEQEFVQLVKKECKYYGVKLYLPKVHNCYMGKGRCAGYFAHEIPELRVAMLNDVWFPTLVHEYCHMRQWIEKDPTSMKCLEDKSYEAWDKMYRGIDVDMELHFSNIRDLELDNERRSVALIKELDLPIDIGEYIRKANCYIMFYNYMKISKKWAKTPPYKNKRLLAEFPNKFSLNYTKLSKRLETIFREEGF